MSSTSSNAAGASGGTPRRSHSIHRERWRLSAALLLSLLIHSLLLSLSFGGQGLGFPGFGFPWQDRRIEVPDLRVVLIAAQAPAADAVSTEPPIVGGLALMPSVFPSLAPRQKVAVIVREPTMTASAEPLENHKPTAAGNAMDKSVSGVVSANVPLLADGPGDVAPAPVPRPEVIALERSDAAALVVPVVPVAPAAPTPVIAVAPTASTAETAVPASRDAGDAAQSQIYAEAQERAVETAKLDLAKQLETERKAAAQQEAARQVAARQEIERGETARLEAERQEAARQAAARQEAARQVAARKEIERGEAARLDTERLEAARQAAARQVAAREEQEARRDAARRAMGRQLDEEAARREAASLAAPPSPLLPATSSSARRGRLFGRTDANSELILYAEAWGRKFQLNMTIDMVREAAKQPHADPLVTVALRSDGSVESVTFVRSSGVAGIDEAIRRIVQSQAPYAQFSPGLAREFDVIEIRRTWTFDTAIRLY